LGQWHLWRGLLGHGAERDEELTNVAQEARREVLSASDTQLDDAVGRALLDVPREGFVATEDVARSARDQALSLDAFATTPGAATLSAMHAYADAFRALGLCLGDDVVELGSGTGYGATLAAAVVGPEGRVKSFELDEALAKAARQRVPPGVQVIWGDAHEVAAWAGAAKVYVTFALPELPAAWLEALPVGGRLVAPVGEADQQWLVHHRRTEGGVDIEVLHPVRYVPDRSSSSRACSAVESDGTPP